MKTRRLIPFAFLSAFLAVFAAHAPAQNILTNPTFDTGISGWSGSGVWDKTKDYGGNAGTNGSLWGQAPALTGVLFAWQCQPATASAAYSFGGKVWAGPSASGNVRVSWYSTTDCSGAIISGTWSPTVAAAAWTDFGTGPLTSPPLTQSAEFDVMVTNGTANFDNLFFGPGTFPVSLQRFDAE
jgi:hypothetical protein